MVVVKLGSSSPREFGLNTIPPLLKKFQFSFILSLKTLGIWEPGTDPGF